MQRYGRPIEVYRTKLGKAVLTKAEDYLPSMQENSVDLVVTSPPFALLRQKAYGNLDQADYVDPPRGSVREELPHTALTSGMTSGRD
jgi:hypothetical protein